MVITDREISCSGSHIWLAQINTASYINSVSFLSKIIFVLRTVNDGFLVMKSVCDIVMRFMAVFLTHGYSVGVFVSHRYHSQFRLVHSFVF